MRECIILLSELFLIGLLQTFIEVILEHEKRPYQTRFINVACILGSLYLIIRFATDNLLGELATVVRFPF